MERGNQGLDGNEQMATSGPKSKSPPFFFSQNSFQGIYDVGSNIKFISCFFVKYCLEDFFCKGGGGAPQIGQKWSANKNFREIWQRSKRLAQTKINKYFSPFLRTMLENSNIMSFATVLITFSDLFQTSSSPLRQLQLLEGCI